MLETFRLRLKAKSTAAGANLSEDRRNKLADKLDKKFPDLKEEADHDAKIDELYDPETLKDFAVLDDYTRTKAAKEKSDKEKADKEKADKEKADKDKSADKTDDQKTSDEPPAWAKALIDQNKAFAEKLEGIEKEKTKTSIQQKLKDHPKLKDLPELHWNKRKLPEKEEEIEAFAEEAATDWEVIAPADKGTGKPPTNTNKTGGNKQAPKEEIDKILDNIKI